MQDDLWILNEISYKGFRDNRGNFNTGNMLVLYQC